jgi:hypothetical protein
MLTDPKLRSQVDSLWDKFWTGGLANPLDAIEQFSYFPYTVPKVVESLSQAIAFQKINRSDLHYKATLWDGYKTFGTFCRGRASRRLWCG